MRTLAALVAVNVAGLLRDVTIAGGLDHGLESIADHAGCQYSEAEREEDWLDQALQAARGPNLFLIRSGFAPEAGFIDEAGDFLALGGDGRTGTAALRAVPESFIERLFPARAPLAGFIAPRAMCLKAPRGSFSALARFIRPAKTLRTCARRTL